ncbi:MAG: FlgD immunoglobulin-like domain containing protein [Gemmatimonadales bacterium]
MSSSPTARRMRLVLSLALWGVAVLWPRSMPAQTFVQLTDLGSGIGPRLTRVVAQQQINRHLFGAVGSKVNFINSGTVYQLVTDPDWARVVVGLKDQWVHAFTNVGGPGGSLVSPGGVDVSAQRTVFVTDRSGSRILVSTLDLGIGNLTYPFIWSSAAIPRPVDVAWDGQSAPLTTTFAYVVDDSLSTVSYWGFPSGLPVLQWSYGGPGSGAGQFKHPSSVCVGKTAAGNGGTQFTSSFYVVDRGNSRIVSLIRGTSGAGWAYTFNVPSWDPTGCAVDFFGNVYVTDQANHHLYKLTSSLGLLDSYGTFGYGANNLNTLAWPHSISVPCGLKSVNSQTVWYCEGRVVTAEKWSDSSGAVEHYLGISETIGQPAVTDPGASIIFTSTDNAYVWVYVYQSGGGLARTVVSNSLWPAGGFGVYWDGNLDSGQPAPSGNYQFFVALGSAYSPPCGASWCSPALWSAPFYHTYCVPPPPGGGGGLNAVRPGSGAPEPVPSHVRLRTVPPPTCGGSADVSPGGRPLAFSVHQLPMVGLGSSEGIAPLGQSAAAGPQLSVAASSARASAAETEALRASVRAGGLTSLQIDLSESSAISVDILDLSGRRVKQFRADAQPAGSYLLHWEGSLEGGGHAPPGVYLTVVRAQGRESTSRLIVMPTRTR